MEAEEAYEQTRKNLKAYANGDLLGGNPYSPIEKYAAIKEKRIREKMLLEFGKYTWLVEEDEDRDLAIGFNDNGMPDSVSLEIHGRNHAGFKLE